MAITDISISEELMTDAPSIKYRGNEGPKSPEQEQQMMADALLKEEYDKYVYDLLEQRPNATPMSFEEFRIMVIAEGQMSGGPVLPNDPTEPVNPFGPKPIGPPLPDRQMAAFGGIMGLDGRRQYGIGSSIKKRLRKIIPNEVAKVAEVAAPFVAPFNPAVAAAMSGIGGFDRTGSIGSSLKSGLKTYALGQGSRFLGGGMDNLQGNPFAADGAFRGGLEGFKSGFSSPYVQGEDIFSTTKEKFFPGKKVTILEDTSVLDEATKAGDYTKGGKKIIEAGKSKNLKLLDRFKDAGMSTKAMLGILGLSGAAGLYTAATQQDEILDDINRGDKMDIAGIRKEVIEAMKDPSGKKLAALRTKYPFLGTQESKNVAIMANGGRIGFAGGSGFGPEGWSGIERAKRVWNSMSDDIQRQYPGGFHDFFMGGEWIDINMAKGGRVPAQEGGLMDLGGMEKDYRAEGGFVPIGAKEKADDVPARLSVNEFVFTADAVRNAGGGDIDKGAEVMENMMKNLEAGGRVSEESQGMAGAQQMFNTSERLSEVVG